MIVRGFGKLVVDRAGAVVRQVPIRLRYMYPRRLTWSVMDSAAAWVNDALFQYCTESGDGGSDACARPARSVGCGSHHASSERSMRMLVGSVGAGAVENTSVVCATMIWNLYAVLLDLFGSDPSASR